MRFIVKYWLAPEASDDYCVSFKETREAAKEFCLGLKPGAVLDVYEARRVLSGSVEITLKTDEPTEAA